MPNPNKRKGDTEERAVVNLLREKGFNCQRTLKSGARSDGSDTHDVDIFLDAALPEIPTLTLECKIKKDGYKTVYAEKGNADILSIRRDRGDRLYVIGEDLMMYFLKLLEAEEPIAT